MIRISPFNSTREAILRNKYTLGVVDAVLFERSRRGADYLRYRVNNFNISVYSRPIPRDILVGVLNFREDWSRSTALHITAYNARRFTTFTSRPLSSRKSVSIDFDGVLSYSNKENIETVASLFHLVSQNQVSRGNKNSHGASQQLTHLQFNTALDIANRIAKQQHKPWTIYPGNIGNILSATAIAREMNDRELEEKVIGTVVALIRSEQRSNGQMPQTLFVRDCVFGLIHLRGTARTGELLKAITEQVQQCQGEWQSEDIRWLLHGLSNSMQNPTPELPALLTAVAQSIRVAPTHSCDESSGSTATTRAIADSSSASRSTGSGSGDGCPSSRPLQGFSTNELEHIMRSLRGMASNYPGVESLISALVPRIQASDAKLSIQYVACLGNMYSTSIAVRQLVAALADRVDINKRLSPSDPSHSEPNNQRRIMAWSLSKALPGLRHMRGGYEEVQRLLSALVPASTQTLLPLRGRGAEEHQPACEQDVSSSSAYRGGDGCDKAMPLKPPSLAELRISAWSGQTIMDAFSGIRYIGSTGEEAQWVLLLLTAQLNSLPPTECKPSVLSAVCSSLGSMDPYNPSVRMLMTVLADKLEFHTAHSSAAATGTAYSDTPAFTDIRTDMAEIHATNSIKAPEAVRETSVKNSSFNSVVVGAGVGAVGRKDTPRLEPWTAASLTSAISGLYPGMCTLTEQVNALSPPGKERGSRKGPKKGKERSVRISSKDATRVAGADVSGGKGDRVLPDELRRVLRALADCTNNAPLRAPLSLKESFGVNFIDVQAVSILQTLHSMDLRAEETRCLLGAVTRQMGGTGTHAPRSPQAAPTSTPSSPAGMITTLQSQQSQQSQHSSQSPYHPPAWSTSAISNCMWYLGMMSAEHAEVRKLALVLAQRAVESPQHAFSATQVCHAVGGVASGNLSFRPRAIRQLLTVLTDKMDECSRKGVDNNAQPGSPLALYHIKILLGLLGKLPQEQLTCPEARSLLGAIARQLQQNSIALDSNSVGRILSRMQFIVGYAPEVMHIVDALAQNLQRQVQATAAATAAKRPEQTVSEGPAGSCSNSIASHTQEEAMLVSPVDGVEAARSAATRVNRHAWTSSSVAWMLHNLRNYSSDHQEVRDLASALADCMKQHQEEEKEKGMGLQLQGHEISLAMYGMQQMNSEHREARKLLTTVLELFNLESRTAAGSAWAQILSDPTSGAGRRKGITLQQLNPKELAMIIKGLRNTHHSVPGVANLLGQIAQLLAAMPIRRAARGDMEPTTVGTVALDAPDSSTRHSTPSSPSGGLDATTAVTVLMGLGSMDADCLEVRALLHVLAAKLQRGSGAPGGVLQAQSVGSGSDTERAATIHKSSGTWNTILVSKALCGLRSMGPLPFQPLPARAAQSTPATGAESTPVAPPLRIPAELREILAALADKLEQCPVGQEYFDKPSLIRARNGLWRLMQEGDGAVGCSELRRLIELIEARSPDGEGSFRRLFF